MRLSLIITTVFVFVSLLLKAQNPHQFNNEVAALIKKDSLINKNDIILFTGSSSIRFWKELPKEYPGYNVLNRGFGGSQMSDLIFYADKLIIPYQPKQIFIYEGDNDLASGKSPEEVINDAAKLLAIIRANLPASVEVIFISAKPSIARWQLKNTYQIFNDKLKIWAHQNKNVGYVDVWTPMLDPRGEVNKEIFIKDGLHLNEKGYYIWASVIEKYLDAAYKH